LKGEEQRMAKGYKTTCPECKKHNFYVTPHNSFGYCFNCGFRQKHGFVTHEPTISHEEISAFRQLYTELTAYYHSCLTEPHRTWLHQRGITDAMIERFRIGYVPASFHILYTSELAEKAGIAVNKQPFLAKRIVFPYLLDGVVYDLRGRSIANEEPKYLSLRNSASLRGATIAYNADILKDKPETLVITEGEIKAIASQQAGVATVAFPGIRSRRNLQAFSTQRVVICFDNQLRHYYDVYRAIVDLATDLLPFTQQIFVALLPLWGEGRWFQYDKMDIDTYILRNGEEAYRNLIETAIPYLRFLQIARGFAS